MKKAELIKQIITSLTERLEVLEKAARASHEEATHESSKAESKYDTRGLEAAYLAGGQARQAKEILGSIKAYEALVTRDFASIEPIGLTALVELDADGSHSTYFIGPKSGGLEIKHRRKEIMVMTPQSPLGQNLIGDSADKQGVFQQHLQALVGKPVAITPTGVNGEIVSKGAKVRLGCICLPKRRNQSNWARLAAASPAFSCPPRLPVGVPEPTPLVGVSKPPVGSIASHCRPHR